MAGHERGAATPHDSASLRRLKWLGVGLPIVFLITIEVFRYVAIEGLPIQHAEHVALAAIVGIGIVIFAVVMFRLIERAEERVFRQNRELTAINAVSTAVQGEFSVDQIIDAALQVLIDRTGATEASVVVFGRGQARDAGLERKVVRASHVSAEAIGEGMPHLIDIPLARGTAVVGRMRLHLAADALQPDLLTSATLNNIGHQLACSIEIGQLIGDLQRQRRESEGLYDVLLRISNQHPLADTLAALARNACDLLDGVSAELRLTPAGTMLLDEPDSPGLRRHDDGSASIVAAGGLQKEGNSDQPAQTGQPVSTPQRLRVSLVTPDSTLGELVLERRPNGAFSAREWEFLHSLGELAVIAVTNARMRETERQSAILAERERIAREMHDSLAQVLGVIHLELRTLRPKVANADPALVAGRLAELADVAEEAYRDVREAILGLRESSRAGRSLFDSLRAYLERYEHQSGVRATLETDLEADPRLSPQAEIHIIRVIQEALTNVRKHASATRATVRVVGENGFVLFQIEDDGHGFDVARAALEQDGGFGLHAMRERIDLIGGTLTIKSAPGRGTRVMARVPHLAAAGTHADEVRSANA